MRQVIPGTGIVALRLVRVSTPRRHDLTSIDESVRNFDRLIEQSTWIVPQIDDVALELVVRDVGLEFGHGLFQAVEGLLVELGDPDIADIVLFFELHRLDGDDGAVQLEILAVLIGPADDLQSDRRPRPRRASCRRPG